MDAMTKKTVLGQADSKILARAEQALVRRMYGEVESACNDVLSRDPRSSRAHSLLGLSFLEQKKIEAAIRSFKKALRIFPDDVVSIVGLGQAHMELGQHALAEQDLRGALRVMSSNIAALRLLILSLMSQGKFQEALGLLDQVLFSDPLDADSFNKRGYVLQQFDRHADAIGNFSRALLLQPNFPEALNNRGNSLKALDRHEEAIWDYDQAILQRPDYILPYGNRSLSLFQLKRFDEAIESCERALSLDKKFTNALINKGLILQKVGRFDESIDFFEQALGIESGNTTAINNLAYSLQQVQRFDESLACYQKVTMLRPDYPEAIWNRGLHKLLRGDMPSGWSDMEWRWRCKEFTKRPGQAGIPEWRGENLNGSSIAIFTEQGFGDLFQFCRYLPKLADAGARVTIVVPTLVHRLLLTLDPRLKVVSPGKYLTGIDFQCTLLSLPDRFRTDLSTIPAEVPYLRAEDALVAEWRKILSTKGFKVGIAWQGNPSGFVDLGRSIPLRELVPLSEIEGVQLISLQFQHGLEQIQALAKPGALRVLPGFNERADGFIDTAAVMKCLDLVITTDTAPAHLAGALNVPVWVLLKSVPDWRWLLDRSDSPWYPSMRLFRQKERGDWRGVVEEVMTSLAAEVAEKSPTDLE
ncbi:tetratricopeptide repeat protein [Mesorhizobium sp. KR9-304]|uniref:tetratricopeptide repeat protein n=1 Tax=Mesorhizobium sp. KR9-304 TaxID=3156614 RepID=UPI0032B56BCB